jgi:hypothetical protein
MLLYVDVRGIGSVVGKFEMNTYLFSFSALEGPWTKPGIIFYTVFLLISYTELFDTV